MDNSLFLNRTSEIRDLTKIIKHDFYGEVKAVLYSSNPATGFTHFIKHYLNQYSDEPYTFFLNGSNKINNSVFAQILIQLNSSYRRHWQSYVNKKSGKSRGLRILSKALAGIPYAGPLLEELTDRNISLAGYDYTAFPSLTSELICECLVEIASEHRVLIFMDNAQDLDLSSMDLIRTTSSKIYHNLTYVFGYIDRESKNLSYSDFDDRIISLGYNIQKLKFNPPNQQFIMSLAKYFSYPLAPVEIMDIVASTEGNIYRILKYFYKSNSLSEIDRQNNLSKGHQLNKKLLLFLNVAQQGLRKSDLIALCAKSPELFYKSISELEDVILEFKRRNIIQTIKLPGGDTLVELQAYSSPEIPDLDRSGAESLVITEQLYRYYMDLLEKNNYFHSKAEISPLLYRLAKKVDNSSLKYHAYNILSSSLSVCSIANAQEYIDEAIPADNIACIEDFLLRVVSLMSLRKYTKALSLLQNPLYKIWADYSTCRILLAFCLNRCRRHKEAEQLVNRLLENRMPVEQNALLLSFKISGLLHENCVKAARELYHDNKNKLKNAKNFPYFLRNASSAFPEKQASDMLGNAVKLFKQNDNKFGLFTTVNNLGTVVHSCNYYKKSQRYFEKAFKGLEIYGVHHLHIIENNLGVVALNAGDIKRANIHFKRSLLFNNNSIMPEVYTKLNKALSMIMENKAKMAIEILEQILQKVENSTFSRMAQKYYINAALIRTHLDIKDKEIERLVSIALLNPDRKNKSATLRTVKAIERAIASQTQLTKENLIQLYSYCLLQYWYQDPYELLSEYFLPSNAEGYNMF